MRIRSLVLFLCCCASFVAAQDPSASTRLPIALDQEVNEEIAIADLPEGVIEELESNGYFSWTIGKAWKNTEDSHLDAYVVELKKGEEIKRVKFDRQGNTLDGEPEIGSGSQTQNDALAEEVISDNASVN